MNVYIQNGRNLNMKKMLVYVDCISGFQTNFSKNKEKQRKAAFYCLFKNTKTKQKIQHKYPKTLTTLSFDGERSF